METVWIVMKDEGYGYEVEGVCSSKEKAELVIEAKKHCWPFGSFGVRIEELEIDGIIKDTIKDLEQGLEDYDKSKSLLDKLKEL